MKKKHRRKKRKYKKILSLFVGISLGGTIFGYWMYANLDYQEERPSLSEREHQLSTPEFLEVSNRLVLQTEKHNLSNGVWSNPDFSETLMESLTQKSELKEIFRLFKLRPVFQLMDTDGKQTIYRVSADLSTIGQIKKVIFPTWSEKNGPNDLKMYEGKFNPETNIWQANILIKNHQETGLYKTKILVTKNNGQTEEIDLGEFLVSEPTLEASIDASKVDKGQFIVNVAINSVSDIEKVSVPIWSKPDQSDLKLYEGERQEDSTYKVYMDYENHNFNNGIYTANAILSTTNGLKVEKTAGTADIQLSQPVRIRLLNNTTLFKDRQLTQEKKKLPANRIAYVVGIVFNSDEKIYKTTEGYISSQNIEVSEMMNDILFVAHRGNNQLAPENSIPAFQLADAWGIETDIQLTKDKKWVIMHDETVDRMTNGKGKISDLTLNQVKELRISSGANYSAYDKSQLVVPTLEEYLNLMRDYGKIPYIEIKPKNLAASDYDSLAGLIDYYGFSNSAIVISFDFGNLTEMKKRIPNLHVQFLSGVLDDPAISKVSSLGINVGLDIQYKDALSKIEVIAKAQNQGLLVNLWGVPTKDFSKVKALGIDNITTDFD